MLCSQSVFDGLLALQRPVHRRIQVILVAAGDAERLTPVSSLVSSRCVDEASECPMSVGVIGPCCLASSAKRRSRSR